MGMSTRVVLLRDKNDPTYQKYLKIAKACIEADIDDFPDEVLDYFKDDPYELEGPLEINTFIFRKGGRDSEDFWEIDIADLPEGVKTIRFINSY